MESLALGEKDLSLLMISEEAFKFLATVISIQLGVHVTILNSCGYLTVQVVCVRDHMLMPVQIEVKFKLLKQGQVVGNNIGKVRVPLAPHWVVKSSCFPYNTLVLLPIVHCLVDPVKLLVALLSNMRVVTNHIPQTVLRRA